VPHVVKQWSKKLCWPWKGPYQVIKIHRGLNYSLQNIHNPHNHQFAHISQLKLLIGKETDDKVNLRLSYVYSGDPAPGLTLVDPQVEIDTILNNCMTLTGVKYNICFKGHTDHYNQWVLVDNM
jgi:hypothetical protein